MTVPALFTPFSSRGVTFRNRIVVSPMCQYAAIDGRVGRWHLSHHARLALGGVGGAVVEATAVTPDGRITHGCTGLYDDGQIAGMAEIVRLYREQGIAVGVQIGHAGRKASSARPWEGAAPLTAGSADPAWRTVAPSALPARSGWPSPRALSEPEIVAVADAFEAATARAGKAGFDFVEIHGAHGYLVHSFFSPISNHRQDGYGGSLDHRMRMPLLIAERVRRAWPADRPVFYRASVVDEVEGGVTLDDTIALAKALKDAGIDAIDCSSGGASAAVGLGTARPAPGFQVGYAEAVRREAKLATMAVGLITEPAQANGIIADGKADLVALGRELLADSNWAYRAACELGLEAPHSVMPAAYAFYLERRAALLARPATVPAADQRG